MAMRNFTFMFLLLAATHLSSQTPLNHLSSPSSSTTKYSSLPTITKPTLQPPITVFPTSTPTSPSPSFATQTTPSGRKIYYKTSIFGCNIEGSASSSLTDRIFKTVDNTTADVLGCQNSCRFTTACQSYSFNTSSSTQNCLMYMADTSGVISRKNGESGTGVFFSMKYPADGSDFCYDDVPITEASETSWLYPYPAKRARATEVLVPRASPSPTAVLYVKNATDCNIQGSLGAGAKSADFAAVGTMQNSIIDCQAVCQRTSSCYSYSWQTANDTGCKCTLYITWMGKTAGAVVEGETGVWFSDKHVADGTIWCYSSTPFMGSGLPGGPIIIT